MTGKVKIAANITGGKNPLVIPLVMVAPSSSPKTLYRRKIPPVITGGFKNSAVNPLNVSLAQFLNEVSQVEKVPAPRPLKNTSAEKTGTHTTNTTNSTGMTRKNAGTFSILSSKG
ncbi:hypothetical protein PIB30_100925 [Stylosanthes scabra]|uniref:Uncharacterized protein n=1 Tax=Stylosanthes scabra TaxID=79078 RepID=A0ABU6TWR5_9FABA|nr:hypothetical protein [Stylosanthes scabra]